MTLPDLTSWLDIEIALREEQRCSVTRQDGFGEQQRSTIIIELRMLKAVKERMALVKELEAHSTLPPPKRERLSEP